MDLSTYKETICQCNQVFLKHKQFLSLSRNSLTLFWDLQFHYSIQKHLSFVAIPSQMNPFPTGQLLSSEISMETFKSILRKT